MQRKILIVGEAWGEKEEAEGRPFVGASGWLLNQLLATVGISREECYVTNVFNLRPKNNNVEELCGPKDISLAGMPYLTKGKYVRHEFRPELQRLYREINNEDPNLIIALGATAAWALLGTSGIRSIRGAAAGSTSPATLATGVPLARTYQVLPTYHPAAVLRDWSLRPILAADLDKARRYSDHREVRRPNRYVWLEPTLGDLDAYEQEYIRPARLLSVDIETKLDQITCVGFSPSESSSIVIPFFAYPEKERFADGNYWPSVLEEVQAWDYVRRWCALKPLLFQNGLYDINRLWRGMGIACRGAAEDTMLLHHALQPEMEKGLAFLGSVYTDEATWKFMSKVDTLKKED